MLAEQVKIIGNVGTEDLRFELVQSIKKSEFVKSASDMMGIITKMDSVLNENITTKHK